MKKNFLMLFLMFAAPVFIEPAFAHIRMTLADGASIRIPNKLFQNVSVIEDAGSRTLIGGSSSESDATLFLFVSETYKQGFDTRNHLYQVLGSTPLETEAIVTDIGKSDLAFFKITSGRYQDYLLAEKILKPGNKKVTFFLLGPQAGFYQISPEFWSLTNSYRPPASFNSVPNREVDMYMVGLALLVVIINIIVIWLGLKKFGQYKLEIL